MNKKVIRSTLKTKKVSSKRSKEKQGVHSEFSKKRGMHSKLSQKEQFKQYLKKIENPDYPWVAKDLPKNASNLEKSKYELCQKILGYQEDNNLTDEEISHRLGLSKEKTLQILFCWIDKFTLDKLITYTNKLFAPTQIQVVIRETRPQKSLYARKV